MTGIACDSLFLLGVLSGIVITTDYDLGNGVLAFLDVGSLEASSLRAWATLRFSQFGLVNWRTCSS